MLICTSWRSDHRSFGVLSIYLLCSMLYIHVLSAWDFHGILICQAVGMKFILSFLQNHPEITFILLGTFLHSFVFFSFMIISSWYEFEQDVSGKRVFFSLLWQCLRCSFIGDFLSFCWLLHGTHGTALFKCLTCHITLVIDSSWEQGNWNGGKQQDQGELIMLKFKICLQVIWALY